MAKPTIVTRAGKGSALTWTEGDTNLTNLRDATITVTDGTNSKALNLNDTLTFTAGTNMTIGVNSSTGAVTVSTTATTNTGTVTSVSGTGTVNGLSLSGTVTSSGSLTLGGTLDLSSPPAIGGTSPSTGAFTTLSASSTVSGTGFSTYLASPPAIGGTTAAAVSATTLTFKDPREAIYDLGTTGGTIAPNVANGSVQKITLNSALTINAFTSPVAGQSLTLIIYGGTAYTSITSTMKFAGGIKTLTGTASCIDILSVYYDGTTYFASLGKGFA